MLLYIPHFLRKLNENLIIICNIHSFLFSVNQHFRGLRGKGFPTDSRHSNGHKLCLSPSRHISVLIQSLLSTGKKKIHLSLTSHTDTSMTYCQSITQILKIIWVRCIPLSFRSKTRRRATPLLPTWIYSCRSRVTVSCALPFTTNVTISTSISQTFRSWLAIFHLHPPMMFLSHSSYGMPGLAPLTNALF